MPGSRRNPRVKDETEDKLQISVAALLEVALLPPVFWTAFPAGMYALERAAGGRLKAYGLKQGVPDIMCVSGHGPVVWIELKRRGGVVSRVQRDTHQTLESLGHHVYICRSPEAVINALLREHFAIRPGVVRSMYLDAPIDVPERQAVGNLYFGKVNAGTAQSGPAKSPEGPATSP